MLAALESLVKQAAGMTIKDEEGALYSGQGRVGLRRNLRPGKSKGYKRFNRQHVKSQQEEGS